MPENITQTVELEAALSPDYEKAFKSAQSMVDGLDKELGQLGKREQKLTELQSMRAKITKATAEGNVKEAKKLQSQYDRLASSLGVAGQDAKGLERELDALRRRQQELSQQRQPFADQLAMRRAANDVARLRANYERFRDPRVGRQLQLAEQRARDLGVTMRRSAGPLRNAAGNLRNMGMQSLESLPGMNKIAQVFGKLPPQAMVVTAAVVGTTAAIVGLGKAGLNTAKEMTSSLDELAKNSRALGINVESYQRLSYAMRRGGASDEQFSTALQTLTKRMDEASNGSKEALKQFKGLGITVDEIKNSNPEEMFLRLADSIAAIEDPVERAKEATRLFGGGGMRIAEAMSVGSDGLRALGKEAERTGNVATEAETKLAEDTADAMENMRMSFEGIKKEIGVAVMPVLLDAAKEVTGIISDNKTEIKNFVSNVIVPSAQAVTYIATGIVKVIRDIADAWSAGTEIFANGFAIWADIIDSMWGKAGELFDWLGEKWDGLVARVQGLPDAMRALGADLMNGLLDGIEEGLNALREKARDVPLLGRLVGDGPVKFGRVDFTQGQGLSWRSAGSSQGVTINNTIDARGAAPGAGADVQRAIAAGNGTAYGQMAKRFSQAGLVYGG